MYRQEINQYSYIYQYV